MTERKALGCIQEQSDILGYDFMGGYRFGMDIGINISACGGMIPSQHVDKQTLGMRLSQGFSAR